MKRLFPILGLLLFFVCYSDGAERRSKQKLQKKQQPIAYKLAVNGCPNGICDPNQQIQARLQVEYAASQQGKQQDCTGKYIPGYGKVYSFRSIIQRKIELEHQKVQNKEKNQ